MRFIWESKVQELDLIQMFGNQLQVVQVLEEAQLLFLPVLLPVQLLLKEELERDLIQMFGNQQQPLLVQLAVEWVVEEVVVHRLVH